MLMDKAADRRLTPIGWWMRLGTLGMAVTPIAIAGLYVRGIKLPLPPCPLRYFTGIPCPTCGMTRSFLAIVHGDLGHAISEHLFGPLVFLVFVLAAGHLLVEVGTGRQINTRYTRLMSNQRWQIGLAIAVAGYHTLRLYHWSASGELQLAVVNSPLMHLLKGL